ncbi:MAG: acyltransferase [Bryobacterales bacterium]
MRVNTALNPSRRFYELDLIRFVAAFAVMMYHYTYRGTLPGGYLPFKFPILGPVFQYGDLGVPLFFIISGFVILMSAQKREWLGFAISRIVRLYPAYWFSVTLTAIVILMAQNNRFSVGPVQYLANLTMIQQLFNIQDVDGVYWSLYVELIFYFWVFLISITRQITKADKILGVWLAASVAINVFGGLTFTDLDFWILPRWSCYFIAGGAFFLIHQRGPSVYLATLALVSYVQAIGLEVEYLERGNPYVVGGLISLFFLVFAAISLDWTPPVKAPWMISAGLLTYPLYLIHQNIGYLLLAELHGTIPRLWSVAVVVTIMLAGSYLIATQIERPLGSLLKKGASRLLAIIAAVHPSLKIQAAEQR